MTAHEVLVKARNLLSDPENWTPNEDEIVYDKDRPGPVCAVIACARFDLDLAPVRALAQAADVLAARADYPTIEVQEWNDSSTHAEVLAAFDRAIAATAPEPDVSFVSDPVAVA